MKLRNKKTTSTHVQENNPINPQQNLNPKDYSRMLVGVTKTKIGGFYARIRNPVTKKREGLGNFKSAEEASKAYLAKKLEFEKIVDGKNGIQGVVCDEKIKKVVDPSDQCLGEKNCSDPCLENQDSLGEIIYSTNEEVNGKKGEIKNVVDKSDTCLENQDCLMEIDSRKERISIIKRKILGVDSRKEGISKKKRNCHSFEGKINGVNKTKHGKYTARIKHPISKKEIWIGTFKSVEEASMAYLNKKTELQNGGQGREGIDCKDNEKKKINCPTFEGKIVRVRKTKSGKYSARIRHPITKNDISVGTFRSFEEASMAYLAKKIELHKEGQGKEEGTECVISEDDGIKKSSDLLGPILEEINHDPCYDNQDSSMAYLKKKQELKNGVQGGKEDCSIFQGKIVRVKKTKSGKYGAKIRHPITKKDIRLGTFRSFEEASMAYLAKKTEFQTEVQGKEEGIEWAISEDDGIKKSSDLLGPILEEINHDPCSDNQDSSMEIECMDSINGESGSRMKNGESPQKELSSVAYSESGAEILMRTESGMPIMDNHGFLLGIWSWIDDLSLPIVDDDN